ncbi:PREDICTED: quinone oxidoreductase-like protein 2 [Dufourea novaeangliae]|uniref:quinone oxidoreductase-like protein 2 n=1 Tax=Dufourea novaeangliae TaxID=178035 RepID=UPI000767AB5A|nr:PREDICTED: quinone oxidoreductase-like protein 2 [Dufourea novaeangliae]
MSVSVGRSNLTHFCKNHLKKYLIRARSIRFSSTAESKPSNLDCKNVPVPEKFTAAVLKNFCNPLIVDYFEPLEISQPNQVVIDVQYCALNVSDILLATNSYTFKPNLPKILGYEFVGKLAQIGEEAKKCGYKVGDKVVALNKDCYGGLSEQCLVEVNDIWKIPSEIKSIHAVALLDDYVTALLALERNISIQESDIILINVGMSSIGLAAVDLATNVYKSQVIAVCATEEGADLARAKGTVLASFKYKDRKLLKQLEELAADKDIKTIFADADGEHLKKVLDCFTSIYRSGATMKDLLRDDNFATVVHHLSREGRVVIAGSTAIMNESDTNRFSVTGFNLREYRKKKPEAYRQAGDDVLQFFEEGLIKPTSVLTVGLCNVNDAMDFIPKSKSPGKVIVDIKNKDAKAKKVKEDND